MASIKERHKKRMELYRKGLSDREIAEETEHTSPAIYQWRKKYGLPSNWRKSREEKRLEMYHNGHTDFAMAKIEGVEISTIAKWRKKYGLSANNVKSKSPKRRKNTYKKRMELYNKGLSDSEIAKKVGITTSGIESWRKRNGLEPNYIKRTCYQRPPSYTPVEKEYDTVKELFGVDSSQCPADREFWEKIT